MDTIHLPEASEAGSHPVLKESAAFPVSSGLTSFVIHQPTQSKQNRK